MLWQNWRKRYQGTNAGLKFMGFIAAVTIESDCNERPIVQPLASYLREENVGSGSRQTG